MAAQIQSSIPAEPTLVGLSRDDLSLTDVVTVQQLPVVGASWAWTLVYVPEGSTAVLTPPANTVGPGPMDFTVDRVGSYLVRLVVDAGLPTESTQYVRLRALTSTLGLKLVAAGERRDATGVIPVDADIEGWANEQNFNLLTLEAAVAAGTAPLADVLGVGNTTGGTDILMTTGDKIVGQTHVEIDSTGAGTNIVLNPDAAGSVVVNGKLTVTGLIDPTGVIFDEAGTPTVAANKGGLFVSDGVAVGETINHLYYQPDVGAAVDLSHAATGGETLAVTLGLGNSTGGNDISVTSGDSITGQEQIVLDEAVGPAGAAGKGAIFVSDGVAAGEIVNHLYYQPAAGSVVDLSVHAAPGGVTSDFIYQPGGTATQNVYTDFTTLYTDLNASTAPKKRIILDDSSTSPVAIPLGIYNLAGVTLTNGKVAAANSQAPMTTISWVAGTVFQNVARVENLMALVAVAGAGTPFTFAANMVVNLEGCWWSVIHAAGDPLFSVAGGSTVYFRCLDSTMGTNTGPVVEGSGTDTFHFVLRGTSSIGDACLKSAGGDTVASVDLSPGSSFSTTQPHWSGVAIPAITSPAGNVDFDPTGMTTALGTDVQTAIGQLDAAGGGSSPYLIPYNLNMPDVPNDTVQYQGWVSTVCVLQAVRAMMVTLNTQGNYTLAVTNVASGNTCLSAATFDMNGLVAGEVTDVTLTGTPADLAFSAPGGATAGRWNVSLVSDDAAFDGSDIYIELVFGVP